MNKIEELEKRIDLLERMLGVKQGAPILVAEPPRLPERLDCSGRVSKLWNGTVTQQDCGCKPNAICGNAACPRMPTLTCMTAGNS